MKDHLQSTSNNEGQVSGKIGGRTGPPNSMCRSQTIIFCHWFPITCHLGPTRLAPHHQWAGWRLQLSPYHVEAWSLPSLCNISSPHLVLQKRDPTNSRTLPLSTSRTHHNHPCVQIPSGTPVWVNHSTPSQFSYQPHPIHQVPRLTRLVPRQHHCAFLRGLAPRIPLCCSLWSQHR